jgi:hypothetical protein
MTFISSGGGVIATGSTGGSGGGAGALGGCGWGGLSAGRTAGSGGGPGQVKSTDTPLQTAVSRMRLSSLAISSIDSSGMKVVTSGPRLKTV